MAPGLGGFSHNKSIEASLSIQTLGDRRQLTTDAVVQRCIAELLEEGKWKDAGNLTLKYDEWLAREADLSEMQEQLRQLRTLQKGELLLQS